MKFSYNWLKELSGTKLAPEKLKELLLVHSFEVEKTEKTGAGLENIFVGKILEIKKHPAADRLSLVKLALGGSKSVRVVCGADNIKVGDKVPLALPEARLAGGLEIKEMEIRGVKSCGMLCAEDELALGRDHSGIMILDPGAKTGASLKKYLELNDFVLGIDILPNRGHDALSHIGVAREICALENRKLDYDFDGLKLPRKRTEKIKVEIKDKNLCRRYIGAVLENIEVKESPVWLKAKLMASGVRPVNNIVDATNYVMLELGQPLHAFDADQVENAEITVRKAGKREEIILLDGNKKELDANDLIVADGKKTLALAGIIGGLDSGISENTARIILESANFNAVSIRKTRIKLGLKTDASDRFEKEIDPNLAEKAMVRAIEIIQNTAGGGLEGIIDVYPQKAKPWKIKLNLDYANSLLGEKIIPKSIIKILNSLSLKTSGHRRIITVEIPTFRIDLKTQEDLIEEIGRIYGYEKIKAQSPKVSIKPAETNKERLFVRRVKNILAGCGFSEVYNYSFYNVRDAGLAQIGTVKHLELENPMNPDQALMRVSLIPNILKNVRENLKRFNEFEIFETGRVYWPNAEALPEEKNIVAGAVILEKADKAENFYYLKGIIDSFLAGIGIKNQYYRSFDSSPLDTLETLWHSGRAAEIKIKGQKESVGYLGEINPFVLANFDIHERVAMFEFDLKKLRKVSETEKEYRPIRKYPTVERDISMVLSGDKGVRADDIIENMRKSGGNLIIGIDLFDVYEFKKEGAVSCAFRVIFGADGRTLTSREIDGLMEKIIDNLEKELNVKVRK